VDPNYYYLELGISAMLGLIFGNKIENIIGAIIITLIVFAGIAAVIEVLSNPTAIANNTTVLVNFTTFAVNFIPSLAIGAVGTAIGIAIGRIIP
jgi:hypothetical protein